MMARMDARELLMLKMWHLIGKLRLDRILRMGSSAYAFTDYFKGMEKAEAVKRIFGDKTEEVLRNLKIKFTWIGGYMWVDERNGHLMINANYLKNGDKIDIYLDLIHELVHVRQLLQRRKLFDEQYSYIDRPTEIEAYRYAVEEARRMGLSDQRICQYLWTEWMSKQDLQKLAATLEVNYIGNKNQ
ncbi:MAG: hypothetical protein QXU38_00265 [Candidatus Bathyarchaeia archaeon]